MREWKRRIVGYAICDFMYRQATFERKVASLWSSLYSRGLRPMPSRADIRTEMSLALEADCTYCGKPIKVQDLSADHVEPLERGGKNEWANIVFCCISCNKAKGPLSSEEFRLLNQFLQSQGDFVYNDVRKRLRAGGGFIYKGWHK